MIGPTHFEWEYADARTARFVTDSDIKHARGEGQIAWLLEPRDLHPENYALALERKDEFDAILMHSHCDEYGALWYPHGGSWIPFNEWGIYSKRKDVSILVSSKNTMEGHKLCHQVAEKFGYMVDIYTNCTKDHCVAPYRYSIVIENERADNYFTEKIVDCFSLGTVPIYWGSPCIGSCFDRSGIIQCGNMQQIGNALNAVDELDYLSRMNAIKRNFDLARQYAACEDYIFANYPELFS